MNKPRAKTEEEVRTEFLDYIHMLAKYWASLPDNSVEDACQGVAFSILSTLDGSSVDLPAMNIVLCPHEEDKQYYIDNNENWYEPGMVINDCELHGEFASGRK